MDQQGRVLVVDDQPVNVKMICRILRDEYELATAENGLQCLDRVDEFKPQVVLLDIVMPELDGYEACRRIKSAKGPTFRQVILVSAKGTLADRLRGYKAMADDYIIKPFASDELLAKVQAQFRFYDEHRHRCEAAGIWDAHPG
jgi:DNA-binding response OmpR family regulator